PPVGRQPHEIAKGDASKIAAAGTGERAAGLLDHGAALLGVEQGRLAGMGADREHEPIGGRRAGAAAARPSSLVAGPLWAQNRAPWRGGAPGGRGSRSASRAAWRTR